MQSMEARAHAFLSLVGCARANYMITTCERERERERERAEDRRSERAVYRRSLLSSHYCRDFARSRTYGENYERSNFRASRRAAIWYVHGG